MRRSTLLLAAATVLALVLAASRHCSRGVSPATTGDSAAAIPPPPPAVRVPAATPAAGTIPVAEHATAHRMRIVDLALDARGLQLTGHTSASGRVKAPPHSVAPWRITFTAFASDGTAVFAGSLDHPLHRRYEYEDPARPGALRSTTVDATEGVLQVRLPAELPVARIAFFELGPDAPPAATGRPLGEIVFP